MQGRIGSKHRLQRLARVRFFYSRDFLGCSGRDDLAAARAAFGAEIDHIVGRFNDVEVMFDNDNGVARVTACASPRQLSTSRMQTFVVSSTDIVSVLLESLSKLIRCASPPSGLSRCPTLMYPALRHELSGAFADCGSFRLFKASSSYCHEIRDRQAFVFNGQRSRLSAPRQTSQ